MSDADLGGQRPGMSDVPASFAPYANINLRFSNLASTNLSLADLRGFRPFLRKFKRSQSGSI